MSIELNLPNIMDSPCLLAQHGIRAWFLDQRRSVNELTLEGECWEFKCEPDVWIKGECERTHTCECECEYDVALFASSIGGDWHLAWKWSEKEDEDGKRQGGFKRIYLHREGAPGSCGSLLSIPGGEVHAEGEFVQAAALVSQPVLYSKELSDEQRVGPAMVHPSETASKRPIWKAPVEPGVKHALFVGIGMQILQQFSGINGVLYYTPQILEEAGVEVLLADIGIGSESASFLISVFTTLLMLPCIGLAMRLVDISGRRQLLLATIPVLIVSIGNIADFGTVVHAVISTICIVVYFCCFVMAYGPIPNILCSESFPTRVRGLCMLSAH